MNTVMFCWYMNCILGTNIQRLGLGSDHLVGTELNWYKYLKCWIAIICYFTDTDQKWEIWKLGILYKKNTNWWPDKTNKTRTVTRHHPDPARSGRKMPCWEMFAVSESLPQTLASVRRLSWGCWAGWSRERGEWEELAYRGTCWRTRRRGWPACWEQRLRWPHTSSCVSPECWPRWTASHRTWTPSHRSQRGVK